MGIKRFRVREVKPDGRRNRALDLEIAKITRRIINKKTLLSKLTDPNLKIELAVEIARQEKENGHFILPKGFFPNMTEKKELKGLKNRVQTLRIRIKQIAERMKTIKKRLIFLGVAWVRGPRGRYKKKNKLKNE